ncbi:hypothetical protein MMC11_001689 [Xylographa trunciseda]|nr:hypothetical protein [Xylographa trunciseda]
MPQSLSSLPAEIVRGIVSAVDSNATLSNLARTSHALYDITIPFLYEHVDLYDQAFGMGSQFTELRPLASLLLRRPDLARLVHHFTMRDAFNTGDHPSSTAVEEGKPNVCQSVDDVFKNAIKIASHDEEEEKQWLEHMTWLDHNDAVLALLLPALPKLQSLDLMLKYGCTYFEKMMRRASMRQKPFDTQPGFLALEDVMHTFNDEKYGMSPEYISIFMRLPFIRGIFGHRVGSDEDVDGESSKILAALETASSTVSHLELKDCTVSESDLAHMLRAPKALKTFIYEVGWGFLSFCNVSFLAIHEALAPQVRYLENLWLDYERSYSAYWDGETDSTTPMPPFTHFEKLKVLKIAIVYIFGDKEFSSANQADWNVSELHGLTGTLPRSLEALHLLHCDDNFELVLLALEDMLKHKRRDVPGLSKLVLDWRIGKAEAHWHRICDITKLADDNDIETTMVITGGENSKLEDRLERGWGMDGEISWAEGVNWLNRYPPDQIVHGTSVLSRN